ncbi:MAG: acetyl-CoA carboxylase biotin carboxyl carrier protein [Acidobacteriota bacterium]
MLTFEQIKELIDQVANHRLSGIELEDTEFRLKIDGHRLVESTAEMVPMAVPAAAPAASAVAVAPSAPAPASAPAAEASEAADDVPAGAHILNSPIVGTFYRSPDPKSPTFVEVGDRVKAGQVLCIVEAMKLMNEIESDADGTVVKIYVENAQAVEFGEPLFAIKSD